MKNILIYFAIYVALFSYVNAYAQQDGSVDSTFNPEDVGITNGVNGYVSLVEEQPDGKVIVAGEFSKYSGQSAIRLLRLNADETLDTSFNVGEGANSAITSLILLSSGKIIIAGNFTSYNGVSCGRIARLNADGSIDATFNQGGEGFNGYVSDLALTQDDKIVVVGLFTAYNNQQNSKIVKLNNDGSLNNTFSSGIAPDSSNYLSKVAVQDDGKILTGGYLTSYMGYFTNHLVRLNTDGSLDTGFEPNYPGTEVRQILIQSDGKIVITGTHTVGISYLLLKYNTDGTDDTSFIIPDDVSDGNMFYVALQADNKVLLSQNRYISRLNVNGSHDMSFENISTRGTFSIIKSAQNGKIYIGGNFNAFNEMVDNSLSRLNADGTKDFTFDIGPSALTGADNDISKVVKQHDNKLVIIGSFQSYNGIPRKGIARLNIDGTLDETFDIGTGLNIDEPIGNAFSKLLSLTADNKIIIAGSSIFTYNGQPIGKVARLNADGSLDTTFTAQQFSNQFGENVSITALAVQPDGKVLIGGDFTFYGGQPAHHLCRLNIDGSLDYSFASPQSWDLNGANIPQSIIVLPDEEKILVGNSNQYVNETFTILKIDYNGNADTEFNSISSQWVRDVKVMAVDFEGKIIVGGLYLDENVAFRRRLARFKANGDIDAVFIDEATTNTSSTSYYYYDIIPQPDGKFIICGFWNDYSQNQPDVVTVLRMNNDGTVDDSFETGRTLIGKVVYSAVLHEDKLVIVGNYTSYNNIGKNRIARIYNSNTLNVDYHPYIAENIIVYRDNQYINVSAYNQVLNNVKVYDLLGRLITEENNINADKAILPLHINSRILIVKTTLSDGTIVTKKIY